MESLDVRNPIPENLRFLFNEYPREAWDENPNFKQSTRKWLGAHGMFRRLADVTRAETERYLDKSIAAQEFIQKLSYYGDALCRNLHGHHGWEDAFYFPELSKADPRFDAGLKILERDHGLVDELLAKFANAANRTISIVEDDGAAARAEAGDVHEITKALEALLTRHLEDEEDLAVPIILHHKLR